MNTAALLHQMCHEDLSQADVNAIGKNRGFAREEFATRTVLENFYLSPAGVAEAMARLTPAEIAILHLLQSLDRPVGVDLFERLYNPTYTTSRYSTTTFTQRYQPVFKKVRTQLVRQGVLVMGQGVQTDSTKMERWRFIFPAEFGPYLPPPIPEIRRLTTPGKVRRDVPRGKLLALIGQALTPSQQLKEYELVLHDGQLLLGGRPFRAAALQEWQKAAWHSVLPGGSWQGSEYKPSTEENFSALDTLTYALNLLQTDEWAAPEQMNAVLEIFCQRTFDTAEVCRLGWEWGYLARNIADGQNYYRLADLEAAEEAISTPSAYLSLLDEATAVVNLQTVPYPALEQLNRVAELAIEDWQLVARPSLIGLGNASAETLASPLVKWLSDHLPAFAEAYQTVQARWGRQIIHTNLYVARVKDLALRVRLEQGLKKDELVLLGEEYVAFPPKLLNKVKRIVTQAGHVIKYSEGP